MFTSTQPSTCEAAFEQSILNEKAAGKLYARFAEQFAHLPQIGNFWKTLMNDEAEHAASLEAMLERLTRAERQKHVNTDLAVRMATISRVIAKKATVVVRDLDEAYELAHELESSEVNSIFAFLAEHFAGSAAQRELLKAEILDHQQRLTDFPYLYGDRQWRRGIQARAPG